MESWSPVQRFSVVFALSIYTHRTIPSGAFPLHVPCRECGFSVTAYLAKISFMKYVYYSAINHI